MTANELKGRPRRRINTQVRMEEPFCWRCGQPFDHSLHWNDRMAFTVDEVIPRSLSADPKRAALTPGELPGSAPFVQLVERQRDEGEAGGRGGQEPGVVSEIPEGRTDLPVDRPDERPADTAQWPGTSRGWRRRWALVTAVQISGLPVSLKVYRWYRKESSALKAASPLVEWLAAQGRVGDARAVEVWSRSAVDAWRNMHDRREFPVRNRYSIG